MQKRAPKGLSRLSPSIYHSCFPHLACQEATTFIVATRNFHSSTHRPRSKSKSAPLSLADRFNLLRLNLEDCDAAIRGKKVPHALGDGGARRSTLRGIRHHDNFGTELRGLLDYPEFTRALNARSIMSNRIPDMKESHEFPYCIWYPDVASETTYRNLAQRYPHMRYQVGRACAVAGYVGLFRELEILPEISIAEEARDNKDNTNSITIFNEIMSSPVLYAVMDDYTRCVNLENPRSGAVLNADTAVLSLLKGKYKHAPHRSGAFNTYATRHEPGLHSVAQYFDITEDQSINAFPESDTLAVEKSMKSADGEDGSEPIDDPRLPLLYSPLPQHLPNINKDLLILRAAYSANIDRYARLRRPEMIQGECACVVRGILQDITFAKWWSLQPEGSSSFKSRFLDGGFMIRKAINARFIMNNDLSRITDETCYDDLPHMIWWPTLANADTYKELLRRTPWMKHQVAHACIVSNNEELYRSIEFAGNGRLVYLLKEAQDSPNPYFKKDLLSKGVEKLEAKISRWDGWLSLSVRDFMKGSHFNSQESLPKRLGSDPVSVDSSDLERDWGYWEGMEAEFGFVERFISESKEKLYSE